MIYLMMSLHGRNFHRRNNYIIHDNVTHRQSTITTRSCTSKITPVNYVTTILSFDVIATDSVVK
jgi:hypothetical protein